MTTGKHRALAILVRETLAGARDTVRYSAETQATAVELTIIAEDLCFHARAERERAQELVGERLGRRHTDAAVVHPGTGQPFLALHRLSPSRDLRSDPSVIRCLPLRGSTDGRDSRPAPGRPQ